MKEWKEITSEKDVQEIIAASETRPQVIFKHSVSCGISAFAKEKLEDGSHQIVAKADFNYLNLLRYRSISNLIASALKSLSNKSKFSIFFSFLICTNTIFSAVIIFIITQFLLLIMY